MKKIIFILIILLYILKTVEVSYSIKIPVINYKTITATSYNNTKKQCDSTPAITAFGYKITNKNKDLIVAVSRDLLPMLPKGTELYYNHSNKIYKKIVMDKMSKYGRKGTNRKFKIEKSIDILMRSYKESKKFGRINKTIYWFNSFIELEEIDSNILYINKLSNDEIKIINKILNDNNITSNFVILNNL